MFALNVDAISFAIALMTVNTERQKSKTPDGYHLKHSWVLVLQLASRRSASNEGEEHVLRARSEQGLCLGNHASASLSSSSSVISLPAEFFSSPPTSSLETVDWSSPSSSSSTASLVGVDWSVCLTLGTRGLRVATPFDLQRAKGSSQYSVLDIMLGCTPRSRTSWTV
jgi:hypothetical protein